MSRLLFAAARGARLQREQQLITGTGTKTRWDDVPIQWGLDDELRIHPDDDHLAYGPISTALREMAEDYSWNPSWEHRVAHAAADDFAVKFHGEPDYPLFYLILAECLADEGL